MKKLKTFDSSYFIGKINFEENSAWDYLVFQPMYRSFKMIAGMSNASYVYYWKSKRLSQEKRKYIIRPNHSTTPNLKCYGTKTRVEFNESFLKQDITTSDYGQVINIYIVYEISKSINIRDYPTLEKWLFGAVTLTKIADINKYKYSEYGIGFDRYRRF